MRSVLMTFVIFSIGCASVDSYIGDLKSGSTTKSRKAALELERLRDPRSVSALVAALAHRDYEVRLRAARALGAIGDRRAVVPLCSVVEHDSSAWVRWKAVEALGELRDFRSLLTLVRATMDGSSRVSFAAFNALHRTTNGKHERIVALLKNEQDEKMICEFLFALAGTGEWGKIFPVYQKFLGYPRPSVRYVAAFQLAVREDAVGKEYLKNNFNTIDLFFVKKTVIDRALSLGADAVPMLFAALRDPDPGIVHLAWYRLENLGSGNIREALKKELAGTRDALKILRCIRLFGIYGKMDDIGMIEQYRQYSTPDKKREQEIRIEANRVIHMINTR